MFLVMLCLPGWTEPPKAAELTPVPKVEPRPSDPIPVEVNKYRVYSVQNHTGPVTWQTEGESIGIKEADKALTLFGVVSGQTDPTETAVPVGALVVWGKAPGQTKVAAWGVVDGKAKLLLTLIFQVGPRPPPQPQPQPQPSGKAAAVLVIDSGSDVWPERGRVKVALAEWTDYPGRNIGRRWVEPTVVDSTGQPPKDLKPWLDRAAGKPVPQIFVATEKGEILFEGPCPKTPADLISLLTKYRE